MKFKTPALVCILILAIFLSALTAPFIHSAGARRQGARDVGKDAKRDVSAVTELPAKPLRFALVIGVDKYVDPQISGLNGASNDAKTLADALTKYAGFPAEQVFLYSSERPAEWQPTRANILGRLSTLRRTMPKEGLLLVSFSGHGLELGGHAFLLPQDVRDIDEVDSLEDTAIAVTQMKERIRATGVKQVLLILDACRTMPRGREGGTETKLTTSFTSALNFDFNRRNKEIDAFAVLYATAVGFPAYEYSDKRQGYFTYALVEGLKGAAANSDGEVTLKSLVDYLQVQVPRLVGNNIGRQQKPWAETGGYKADGLVLSVTEKRESGSGEASSTEITFWTSAEKINSLDAFRAYLAEYPNGRFRRLAVIRQAQLMSLQPETATVLKLDEYGAITFGDEKARLDTLANDLQQIPSAQAYIIAYGGRTSRPNEAQTRAGRAKDYLVNIRGVDPGRIVTVDGGFREESTVEIWIVPVGAAPPMASPTVDPDEVKPKRQPRREPRRNNE